MLLAIVGLRAQRTWLVALFVGLLTLAASAAAQDASGARAETDPAAAEVLFQKGREAMLAEDYDSACQFFLESLSLDQAVGTVMNLAVCEEKRGHLTASWERWHQALRLLEPSDDRVLFAEDQLTWISARLAHLTIRLTGAAASEVTIKRDGIALGTATLGQELPVDPGSHTITVEGPRFEPKRYTVSLESGETKVLPVSPGARRVQADTPTASDHRTVQLIGALAAFGVGAAGITTAIVTGVLLPGKDRKVEHNCPNQMCNEEGLKTISEAQTMLALNTAGWIAAGVGVAGGTVLLLTLPKKKPDGSPGTPDDEPSSRGGSERPSAERDVVTSVRLTPTGIFLCGSF